MKTTYIGMLIAFVFCILMVACDDDSSSTGVTVLNKPYTVYVNSFESPSDTVGWEGLVEFRNDAPPDGGTQSLFVSGGCVMPHAMYELEPLFEDSYLTVRCWGKRLLDGGIVHLGSQGMFYEGVSLHVSDSVWTFYESPDSIFCPANQSVYISLASGGFVPDSMLVDMIEVVRVE